MDVGEKTGDLIDLGSCKLLFDLTRGELVPVCDVRTVGDLVGKLAAQPPAVPITPIFGGVEAAAVDAGGAGDAGKSE